MRCFVFLLCFTSCRIPDAAKDPYRASDDYLFKTGPYLLLGGEGKVFVALKQELSKAPVIEWWVDDRDWVERVTAVADEDLWVATLKNLPIGPKVSYRVLSELGDTPTYRFRAGTKLGDPFRFVAFGDTRTGHEVEGFSTHIDPW